MAQSFPMNGGDGEYSYTKNSTMQGNAAIIVKDVMKDTLIDNLDMEELLCGSTTFTVADFGCSVGPNTFKAVQTLIETVEHRYKDSKKLEFQVFFNDQTANDFNTLFASLPNPRNYFAAGVPGSFYGRLFPSSSIYLAYSSYSLNWLSKVPEELLIKDSPAWNTGRYHYIGAPDAVVKAYANQFEADFVVFLSARSEEIVAGGMMVFMLTSVPEGCIDQFHGHSIATPFFESILTEMIKEGVVEQEKLDTFNFPSMSPTMKDVRRFIEENGCFDIVKMELSDVAFPIEEDGTVNIDRLLMLHRAAMEGTFANHFGNVIVDQLFGRAMYQKLKLKHIIQSSGSTTSAQLFVALKRK